MINGIYNKRKPIPEKIKELYDSALSYYQKDNDVFMFKARQIIETIVESLNGEGETLCDQINSLKERGILDELEIKRFHYIRKYANVTIHREEIDALEYQKCKYMLVGIIENLYACKNQCDKTYFSTHVHKNVSSIDRSKTIATAPFDSKSCNLRKMKECKEENDLNAQIELAKAYEFGIGGIEKDLDVALKLYKKIQKSPQATVPELWKKKIETVENKIKRENKEIQNLSSDLQQKIGMAKLLESGRKGVKKDLFGARDMYIEILKNPQIVDKKVWERKIKRIELKIKEEYGPQLNYPEAKRMYNSINGKRKIDYMMTNIKALNSRVSDSRISNKIIDIPTERHPYIDPNRYGKNQDGLVKSFIKKIFCFK